VHRKEGRNEEEEKGTKNEATEEGDRKNDNVINMREGAKVAKERQAKSLNDGRVKTADEN
jgi:hypothetical protein